MDLFLFEVQLPPKMNIPTCVNSDARLASELFDSRADLVGPRAKRLIDNKALRPQDIDWRQGCYKLTFNTEGTATRVRRLDSGTSCRNHKGVRVEQRERRLGQGCFGSFDIRARDLVPGG